MILDGDHNYHTLSGELAAIAERAEGSGMPLLLIHDIGWPHAGGTPTTRQRTFRQEAGSPSRPRTR